MGQSKGSGYNQVPTLPPNILQMINQLASQSQGYSQQAAQGYQDFLPGGKGGQPIIDAAMKNYQQRTIPSILNAFGTNNRGSSALNQALASSGSDLNTNLGSQLAQMQLEASRGLGGLATSQQNLAAQTPQFALQPRQPPWWQTILPTLIEAAGTAGGAYLGGPSGAAAGNAAGKAVGKFVGPSGSTTNQGFYNPYTNANGF